MKVFTLIRLRLLPSAPSTKESANVRTCSHYFRPVLDKFIPRKYLGIRQICFKHSNHAVFICFILVNSDPQRLIKISPVHAEIDCD